MVLTGPSLHKSGSMSMDGKEAKRDGRYKTWKAPAIGITFLAGLLRFALGHESRHRGTPYVPARLPPQKKAKASHLEDNQQAGSRQQQPNQLGLRLHVRVFILPRLLVIIHVALPHPRWRYRLSKTGWLGLKLNGGTPNFRPEPPT